MQNHDLSRLAEELRRNGYDARNLADVGITVWWRGNGHYFPAEEASRLATALSRNDLESLLQAAA